MMLLMTINRPEHIAMAAAPPMKIRYPVSILSVMLFLPRRQTLDADLANSFKEILFLENLLD